MPTDVIDGLTVTFPTASPHVITARLGSVTTSVTIEVIPTSTPTSSTTTTTAAPTSTIAPTPPTTPTSPTSPVPPTLAPVLPSTGTSSTLPTFVAAVLLLAGVAIVAVTRHPARRRS